MNEQFLFEHARQFNEAVSALIELEAMKADNKQRELKGKSLSYDENDFLNLFERYGLGHNGVAAKCGDFYKL